jgi:hypothetical protein
VNKSITFRQPEILYHLPNGWVEIKVIIEACLHVYQNIKYTNIKKMPKQIFKISFFIFF